LLGTLAGGTEWLRAVICTLARRGVRLRQAHPDRAAKIIEELSRWPFFKGGQFLFDLLEWEDFLVDGPAPAPVAHTFTGATWARVAAVWRDLQDMLVPGVKVTATEVWDPETVTADVGQLPALEPGLYLFHDVALGLFESALIAQSTPPSVPGAPSTTGDA
jgi:hypothetical protein